MTKTKDLLLLKIAEMESNGIHHYDPVRFCYIQSMARRASGKSGLVYTAIETKALAALDEYRKSFNSARLEAEQMVNRVCSVFPDEEIIIREFFDNNEFNKVLRLGEKLDRRNRQTDCSVLQDLVVRFTPDCGDMNNQSLQSAQSSIDDLLRQQERDTIASLKNLPQEGSVQRTVKSGTGNNEIKSLQRFKTIMLKLHSDRLVSRAVQNLPENSGPHNSQMLATTALFALHQISPNYLNRFVSHIGTLIYLKQTGEDVNKLKPKKKKKTRPA